MALNGEFSNEDRWISREDFFRLKDTDPYAAICFSFGNDLKTYAYSREIEQKKKALHYAIFFDDFTLSDKEFGIDLRPISSLQDRIERYLLAKRLLRSTPPPKILLESLQRHCRNQVSKHGTATADVGE